MNLYLLQRRPEEWKDWQSTKSKELLQKEREREEGATGTRTTGTGKTDPQAMTTEFAGPLQQQPTDNTRNKSESKKAKKRKRAEEEGPRDEIDEVFASAFGEKRTKRAALKAI